MSYAANRQVRFGANIALTQWVVGAIGPQLGLSLVQSIVIMVVGQAAGALIFGVFTLMGKGTGVSQLALGRMAFGRRGNNIPSVIHGVITLSWTGLATISRFVSPFGYVPLRTRLGHRTMTSR